MLKIGLTGSIGMGKSTTAAMFAQAGIPVHDADAVVHQLYQEELIAPIEAAFPGTTNQNGVDRARLGASVLSNPQAMAKLEAIVHPAVRAKEAAFLVKSKADGHSMVILDIPLLFETGAEARLDKIVVVTAPADVQRERVLARAEMNEEKFQLILAKQVPDAEKRRRADFLVHTDRGMENARQQVAQIIESLSKIPVDEN